MEQARPPVLQPPCRMDRLSLQQAGRVLYTTNSAAPIIENSQKLGVYIYSVAPFGFTKIIVMLLFLRNILV
ncbi:hypothetical protein BDW69DRAFT_175573 [Aspergillus filifer]